MAEKNYSILLRLTQFLLQYKGTLIAASIALIFTAIVTLAMGQGVRILIDDGFVAGSRQQLNNGAVLIIFIAILMSIGTYCRFYLVSWLGERVSADIRQTVSLNRRHHIITNRHRLIGVNGLTLNTNFCWRFNYVVNYQP